MPSTVLSCLSPPESVAEQYLAKFPGSNVVAETRSDTRHESLRALGVNPRTRDSPDAPKATNVVFCAAPGGNEDYPAEVRRAVSLWGGKDSGRMVFTSSSGVFAETEGKKVDEDSVVDSESPRVAKLLAAEREVLCAGGSVVRLAGLYSIDRGAHSFWIKNGKCTGASNGLIGLVSYEDAASSCLTLLTCDAPADGVYVVCDEVEQTRKQIVDSALKTKMWGSYGAPEMDMAGDPLHAKGVGKRYDASKIRSKGWVPKYASFDEFCEQN